MAHPHESRDGMIAMIVGGIGFILILLYLYGGSHNPQTVDDNGQNLPTVTTTPPRGQTAYNYNIAPYNPDPGLTYGKSVIPDYTRRGDGCCNDCGITNGQQYNNVNVAQFMTLMGYGTAAGAGYYG